MEGSWKGTKEVLTSTCHEVLVSNNYHHEGWISIETLRSIRERKNKKITIEHDHKKSIHKLNTQKQTNMGGGASQVKTCIRQGCLIPHFFF
ncbi:unnamed protein product [Schistosoma margrebowiei]|uniref:Uncharacterized protein n=1 Tax=Schistosoma margrebowiei TaxID=48269 RepID=A0A183M016_9TREM|nr:unnamed protein product [Schistosoma margrebowiei]